MNMRDVVVNVPKPPPPSRLWKVAALGLGLLGILVLTSIEIKLGAIGRVLAVIAMNTMGQDFPLSPPPRGPLKPASDKAVIHKERGAPVVTLLGQGQDPTEFRYAAVSSFDGAFAIVVDRLTGVVWQCVGAVTNTTVDGKLPLQCAQVYDGPVIVQPKGKK